MTTGRYQQHGTAEALERLVKLHDELIVDPKSQTAHGRYAIAWRIGRQALIDDLQRQLLAILKRERQPLRAGPMAEVVDLRRRLAELDSKACLYPSWGGPMPDAQPERRVAEIDGK